MSDRSIAWMINGGRRAESDEARRQRTQRADLEHLVVADHQPRLIRWAAARIAVLDRFQDVASRLNHARSPRTPDCCPA